MSNNQTVEKIEKKLEINEIEYKNQNESMIKRIKEYAINEINYQNQIKNLMNELKKIKKETIVFYYNIII